MFNNFNRFFTMNINNHYDIVNNDEISLNSLLTEKHDTLDGG